MQGISWAQVVSFPGFTELPEAQRARVGQLFAQLGHGDADPDDLSSAELWFGEIRQRMADSERLGRLGPTGSAAQRAAEVSQINNAALAFLRRVLASQNPQLDGIAPANRGDYGVGFRACASTSGSRSVAAAVARVQCALGVSGLAIRVSAAEVNAQRPRGDGSVDFETALRRALESFLHDHRGAESPGHNISTDILPSGNALEVAESVRDFMNRGGQLSLASRSAVADHGERVADNWIFRLTLPGLSDHVFWAIVDRQGRVMTYNYGFN